MKVTHNSSFFFKPVTAIKLENLRSQLKNTNSYDVYNMAKILKPTKHHFAISLSLSFNKCLKKKSFTKSFSKKTKIRLILKLKNADNMNKFQLHESKSFEIINKN